MATDKESVYWMESEVERKRLASNHYIAKDAAGGKLVLAPVDLSQPARILDSATADGTWLLDLRSDLENGSAHTYIGTDLNPNPFPASPPANVTFQVQDISKPWPEELKGTFDLVHQRLALLGAGPNPQPVVHGLCELVKPGGWVQLIEAAMVFPEDTVNPESTPVYCDMLKVMKAVAGHVGAAWEIGGTLRGHLEAEGFTDVQEKVITLKMGKTHPDEQLARNGVVSCGMAIEGLSAFAKTFPPEKQPLAIERYDTLRDDLVKELSEKGAVFPLTVVWARKPL
ncbi:hypothetical protein N0V90_012110 [Kalmusia sp. IMI 367209]|nr:hypothetical protein N0V90_012110 [Kalmusia sp. IMI 367209]